MEELEDMKQMWLDLNNRLAVLEEENRRLAKKVMNEKYKTAQDRLVRKYRIFIIVACVMIIYSYCLIYMNPMVVEKYRLLTTIYLMCLFALCAATDTYLLINVKDLDIYGSNMKEVTRIAARNWKIHKLFLAVGLPVAIGAVVLMALALEANSFTILGMIVGGVVGFMIGIYQLLKFRNYYRLFQTDRE
ncbi:MAG: hypothetical protein J1E16_01930 [Muribaculaceae bacterium]|nr:hypothetical protein [Muribaculaceae bacterium]